jgi:hypothetical protein
LLGLLAGFVTACGSSSDRTVDAHLGDGAGDGTSATCAASPSNTRARWRGENNPNDDTGTYNGTATGSVTYVAGRHGMAFQLDGATSMITADPNDALWPMGSFSIEAWVRTTSLSGTFISKYGCAGNGTPGCDSSLWRIRLDDAGHPEFEIRVVSGPTPSAVIAMSNPVNDGAWHHLIGVRDVDSKVQLLYVDGVDAGEQDISGSSFLGAMTNIDMMSDPITIGAAGVAFMTTYQSFLPGAIDEVAYYDSAITATQAAAIYAARDGVCH